MEWCPQGTPGLLSESQALTSSVLFCENTFSTVFLDHFTEVVRPTGLVSGDKWVMLALVPRLHSCLPIGLLGTSRAHSVSLGPVMPSGSWDLTPCSSCCLRPVSSMQVLPVLAPP